MQQEKRIFPDEDLLRGRDSCEDLNVYLNPMRRFFVKGPVWLVDDMECALEIMRLFLEKNGNSTVIYSCPLKALHDLNRAKYHN